MIKTHFMTVNTNDPEAVCEAIDELYETYKDVNIITILTEGLNHYIFYQLGTKDEVQDINEGGKDGK